MDTKPTRTSRLVTAAALFCSLSLFAAFWFADAPGIAALAALIVLGIVAFGVVQWQRARAAEDASLNAVARGLNAIRNASRE